MGGILEYVRIHYITRMKPSQLSGRYKNENVIKSQEKLRVQNALREARKYGAVGIFTVDEWIDKVKEYNNRCAYCGIILKKMKRGKFIHNGLTIDHIIPPSKGGDNYISNIVPSCSKCNLTKSDKLDWFKPMIFSGVYDGALRR